MRYYAERPGPPVSVSNGKDNRCHEAIQIYALVEADAERQIIEKTEFVD